MKKRNNIKKINKKPRIRGTPMFDNPVKSIKPIPDQVMEPETVMDVARLLVDEIKKKWPDAQTPNVVSGIHLRKIKEIVSEFDGEVIKAIIRILVWDFDEIKKNKAFFPYSSHLNWPWIDQLYNYRLALASSVNTGITDATSRSSAYAQRYLNKTAPTDSLPEDTKTGTSMKDIAKKLLGQ